MIAAGCSDHAGGRHDAGQKIGDGTASLERSGVLEEFQLEDEGRGGKSEIAGVDIDNGRAADERANDGVGSRDSFAHAQDVETHELVL